jgi:hypothetical protein
MAAFALSANGRFLDVHRDLIRENQKKTVVGGSRHGWRLYVCGFPLAGDSGSAASRARRGKAGEVAADDAEGINETSEVDDMDEQVYVQGYVVQWGDVWLVIPVLLLLVLGGVKLVKLLLMALKG